MVKVGNSECEFLKLTPLSRTSAIAGAVCGVTMRPRKPSGTNRIRLRGAAFCADAAVAVRTIRLADSNTVVRRIRFSPSKGVAAICRCLRLVLLCDRFVTGNPRGQRLLIQDCPMLDSRPQDGPFRAIWALHR